MEPVDFILRILFTHSCSYNDFFLMLVETRIKKKSLQEHSCVNKIRNIKPQCSIFSISCSNVSVIDDICDETVCESFSHIELPVLEQTEGIRNVKVNPELTDSQKTDINNVLEEFSDIFTDVPLVTNCIEHEIKLTSDIPIRLKPYPLPFSSEKIVKEEVDIC